ncbi:MAG: hypothetical protein ACP5NX_00715 [Candidatus Bilamarchaeaceae archaeon]
MTSPDTRQRKPTGNNSQTQLYPGIRNGDFPALTLGEPAARGRTQTEVSGERHKQWLGILGEIGVKMANQDNRPEEIQSYIDTLAKAACEEDRGISDRAFGLLEIGCYTEGVIQVAKENTGDAAGRAFGLLTGSMRPPELEHLGIDMHADTMRQLAKEAADPAIRRKARMELGMPDEEENPAKRDGAETAPNAADSGRPRSETSQKRQSNMELADKALEKTTMEHVVRVAIPAIAAIHGADNEKTYNILSEIWKRAQNPLLMEYLMARMDLLTGGRKFGEHMKLEAERVLSAGADPGKTMLAVTLEGDMDDPAVLMMAAIHCDKKKGIEKFSDTDQRIIEGITKLTKFEDVYRIWAETPNRFIRDIAFEMMEVLTEGKKALEHRVLRGLASAGRGESPGKLDIEIITRMKPDRLAERIREYEERNPDKKAVLRDVLNRTLNRNAGLKKPEGPVNGTTGPNGDVNPKRAGKDGSPAVEERAKPGSDIPEAQKAHVNNPAVQAMERPPKSGLGWGVPEEMTVQSRIESRTAPNTDGAKKPTEPDDRLILFGNDAVEEQTGPTAGRRIANAAPSTIELVQQDRQPKGRLASRLTSAGPEHVQTENMKRFVIYKHGGQEYTLRQLMEDPTQIVPSDDKSGARFTLKDMALKAHQDELNDAIWGTEGGKGKEYKVRDFITDPSLIVWKDNGKEYTLYDMYIQYLENKRNGLFNGDKGNGLFAGIKKIFKRPAATDKPVEDPVKKRIMAIRHGQPLTETGRTRKKAGE